MRKDGNKWLTELRQVDFALQELVLYLNAYPHTPEALAYYHKLRERRAALTEEYQKSCGPMTAMGNESHNSWDWVDTPFPWEYEAN